MSTSDPTPVQAAEPILVSVIIPAFNAARFLEPALRSALAQDLSGVGGPSFEGSLEVIVVDDASSDETAALVEGWSRSDSRVRLLRLDRNGGPARARNAGLLIARGVWIAVLDADDSMEPRRLATLVRLAERYGADVVADNLRFVDAVSGATLRFGLSEGGLDQVETVNAQEFIRRNHFASDTFSLGYLKPLFRRAFLVRKQIRYDEDLRIAEDFQIDLECLLAGARFVITSWPGYRYAVRPGSISRQLTVGDLDRLLAACQRTQNRVSAPALRAALRQRELSIVRMRTHAEVLHFIKRGRLDRALVTAVLRPGVWPLLVRYGRESVLKRLGWLASHGVRQERIRARPSAPST